MKKIFTIAAAALLMGGNAFAQRTVDVETTLTSPATGASVVAAQPFSMSFTVKNNGPDVVKAGDTLIFVLVIGNQAQLPTARVVATTDDIAVGASKSYTVPGLSISGGQSGSLTLCALVILTQQSGTDNVKDDVLGGNNVSCAVVNYTTSATGIFDDYKVNEIASRIYPNPVHASGAVIQFEAQDGAEAQISIYDVTGKAVVESTVVASGALNSFEVDASLLENGIYVYEVRTSNMVTRNKFIVSK
jgi:hypothetical protein